jgi:hypothetical protein
MSQLKNIRQDISKAELIVVEENLMTTILIVGLPSSYKHFLKTLHLTGKLEKITFYQLSELLAQHDKNFGKKKQVGKYVFFTKSSISKPSTQSSRGRGAQFRNRGCGNQDQYASIGQGRGQSQRRERDNDQGRGNNQGR